MDLQTIRKCKLRLDAKAALLEARYGPVAPRIDRGCPANLGSGSSLDVVSCRGLVSLQGWAQEITRWKALKIGNGMGVARLLKGFCCAWKAMRNGVVVIRFEDEGAPGESASRAEREGPGS